MNKFYIFFALSLTTLFGSPLSSEAYFTTNQTATKISDTSAIYTISYQFGHDKRDMYLPILADFQNQQFPTLGALDYDLVDSDRHSIKNANASAFIFTNDTDVTIKDNQYLVPRGKIATFTLVVIGTIPDHWTEGSILTVSNLPFLMIENDTKIPAKLNPSELQYYQTPILQ